MHVRQQIREAVKDALGGIDVDAVQGTTAVFANRSRPLAEQDLPAIRIQTLGEETEQETLTSVKRILTLSVEALIGDQDNAWAALDDYAEEIEQRIAADATLSNLVNLIDLASTEIELSADHGIRQLTLTYSIHYMTTNAAPNIAL